jgi:hypothetical protein
MPQIAPAESSADSFSGLLASLAAPQGSSAAPWDDGLADDIATISYEPALRTSASRPAPPTEPAAAQAPSGEVPFPRRGTASRPPASPSVSVRRNAANCANGPPRLASVSRPICDPALSRSRPSAPRSKRLSPNSGNPARRGPRRSRPLKSFAPLPRRGSGIASGPSVLSGGGDSTTGRFLRRKQQNHAKNMGFAAIPALRLWGDALLDLQHQALQVFRLRQVQDYRMVQRGASPFQQPNPALRIGRRRRHGPLQVGPAHMMRA